MLGFHDCGTPEFENPRDRVEWDVRDCWHFKGEESIDIERKYVESYNKQDRDGRILRNGDLRYFRHYDGRLMVGRAYFRLNNQWSVIAGGNVYGPASFQMFSDPTGEPRRIAPEGRIKSHLRSAIERQDFERAIFLRDQLAARAA